MGLYEMLFMFIFTTLVGELLRPKPKIEQARKAGLGDFNFPTATEGRPVPIPWGTVMLQAPNVTWYGDKTEEPITEKVKTGLFSSSTILKGYKYHLGIQFGLCYGEGVILKRIRVKEEDVFSGSVSVDGEQIQIDSPKLFGGDEFGSGGLIGPLRWYTGSSTQNPDPYLQIHQNHLGGTPAYRYYCYAVWEHGYLGDSTTIEPWEFEVERIPDGLGLGANARVNTYDANPANVIFELYTNEEWGMALPLGDIDTASFIAAGNTLAAEGNGFSFVLDTEMEVSELVKEIERQIDGVVILDRSTGLRTLNLVRGGYDINTIPQIDQSNIIEIEDYSRGSWIETTNEARLLFINRANNYAEAYSFAQDLANQRIQGSVVAATPINYPGVKDGDLANSLVWRELYSYSQPLAKITVVVDRTFWNANRGDIMAFSSVALDNLVQLPVRVIQVGLGEINDDRIVLDLIEDTFAYRSGVFSAPGSTEWLPPSTEMVDIPAADRLMMEAPRAISHRDPENPDIENRVWAGFRSQAKGEVLYNLTVATIPVGQILGSLYAGELRSAIVAADHGGSIAVDGSPDAYAALKSVLSSASDSDIGVGLANLIMIGDEFIAFKGWTDNTTYVTLTGCYRGLLDSVVEPHAENDRVWFMFVNGGISSDAFPLGNTTFKVLPESSSDKLDEASSSTTVVNLDNRHKKPYPVSKLEINDSVFRSSAASLATSVGAPDDGKGLKIEFVRRHYQPQDEVLACLNENNLPSGFPSDNTTVYEVYVRNDPDGANTLLLTDTYDASNLRYAGRTAILRQTLGVIPTRMRVAVKTQHFYSGFSYQSEEQYHDFNVGDSELSAMTNLGLINENVTISAYASAPDTGTYTFTIQSDLLSTGVIEARINGGAWGTVIGIGLLTGTLTGVTATDLIEFRSTQTGPNWDETLLTIEPPTTSDDKYGILII